MSHYFYRLKTNQTRIAELKISFTDWVELTYGKQNEEFFDKPKMFMPQLKWLTDENGRIIVDFVGRFEQIDTDFQKVCRRIGLHGVQLPHLKKTKHFNYRYYYNDRTKRIIEEWFHEDIEYFEYRFD